MNCLIIIRKDSNREGGGAAIYIRDNLNPDPFIKDKSILHKFTTKNLFQNSTYKTTSLSCMISMELNLIIRSEVETRM